MPSPNGKMQASKKCVDKCKIKINRKINNIMRNYYNKMNMHCEKVKYLVTSVKSVHQQRNIACKNFTYLRWENIEF